MLSVTFFGPDGIPHTRFWPKRHLILDYVPILMCPQTTHWMEVGGDGQEVRTKRRGRIRRRIGRTAPFPLPLSRSSPQWKLLPFLVFWKTGWIHCGCRQFRSIKKTYYASFTSILTNVAQWWSSWTFTSDGSSINGNSIVTMCSIWCDPSLITQVNLTYSLPLTFVKNRNLHGVSGVKPWHAPSLMYLWLVHTDGVSLILDKFSMYFI